MKKLKYLTVIISLSILHTSCHEEWLDIKRDKMQVVPESLQDFQALLDNTTVMNRANTPSFGAVSADDYYVTYENWQAISSTSSAQQQKNAYIWAKNIYTTGDRVFSWELPYGKVFCANVALEGIENIDATPNEQEDWNTIKGSALFYRAWAFYQLAQIFCKPYDPSTANKDPGIPLRLESDITIRSVRATVQQTYDRIIQDLKIAIPLLPDIPLEKTRPGKAAAYALLARTYLLMGTYDQALAAASSSLDAYSQLLNYNTVDVNASYPFVLFNSEVIFHTSMHYTSGPLVNSRLNIDAQLYQSYDEDDLRKNAFFWDNNGTVTFKGTYSGSRFLFTGIATDEVYLIRSECYARMGEPEKALQDLNALLEMRYATGKFTRLTAADAEDALHKILTERRKELVFRGIRWSDLRRLNKDPRFAKTLVRELNGDSYSLAPDDRRYVFPIPHDVIELTGMSQNPR